MRCQSLFCATCKYPHYCDLSCGYPGPTPDPQYPGMAPGAKIAFHDFGDEHGNLDGYCSSSHSN